MENFSFLASCSAWSTNPSESHSALRSSQQLKTWWLLLLQIPIRLHKSAGLRVQEDWQFPTSLPFLTYYFSPGCPNAAGIPSPQTTHTHLPATPAAGFPARRDQRHRLRPKKLRKGTVLNEGDTRGAWKPELPQGSRRECWGALALQAMSVHRLGGNSAKS